MFVNREEFENHLRYMRSAEYLVVDTEGSLTHPFSETWGLSYSYKGVAEYFPFRHKIGKNLPASWLEELKDVLENHQLLVFHNAKHDIRALRNWGIVIKRKFYCTQLMAHYVNENWASKALEWLGQTLFGKGKKLTSRMKGIIEILGWEGVPSEEMYEYAKFDPVLTEELFLHLYPTFIDEGYEDVWMQYDMDFVRLVAEMSDVGVLIDQDRCEQEIARGTAIMQDVQKFLGFDPGRRSLLKNFFLDELGLPPIYKFDKKTKTNKITFDKHALEIYDEHLSRFMAGDKRAQAVLTYRGWQKTIGSNYKPYLNLMLKDGRLHADFKIHGTVNWRLSCADPNLQQIPRASIKDWNGKLKHTFVARPGYHLWAPDYAQLELRMGVWYGKVKWLLDVLNDRSLDVFKEMGAELNMPRQDVKTLVYTLQFTGGAQRISEVFGVSLDMAKSIKSNYFRKSPGLLSASNRAIELAAERGFVRMWSGRRRHLKGDECRKAFSSLCQGGGFDVVKISAVEMWRAGLLDSSECKMNLQVHDCDVFEIEKGKEHIYLPEIQNYMENTVKDKFPVRFHVSMDPWVKDAA